MDRASVGVILLIVGLIFIYASYSEPNGPGLTGFHTQEERDYWAPKCIDWTDDSHPYWYSDGSNMCYEYAKEWNYTTAAIGALMIIGGIACFFVSKNSSLSSTQGTNSYVQPLAPTFPQNIQNKPKTPRRKKNSVKNKMSLIKELRELQDAGGLSDTEFKQMKKEILGK